MKLRDRVGVNIHFKDVACRNILYNSTLQSGAEIAKDLLNAGVRWFRVNLEESGKMPSKRVRYIESYSRSRGGKGGLV